MLDKRTQKEIDILRKTIDRKQSNVIQNIYNSASSASIAPTTIMGKSISNFKVEDGQVLIYDKKIDSWIPGNPSGDVDLSDYYTKEQVDGLIPVIPTIPDQLSDLTDDSTHRLVTDAEKTTWNAKSDITQQIIEGLI